MGRRTEISIHHPNKETTPHKITIHVNSTRTKTSKMKRIQSPYYIPRASQVNANKTTDNKHSRTAEKQNRSTQRTFLTTINFPESCIALYTRPPILSITRKSNSNSFGGVGGSESFGSKDLNIWIYIII